MQNSILIFKKVKKEIKKSLIFFSFFSLFLLGAAFVSRANAQESSFTSIEWRSAQDAQNSKLVAEPQNVINASFYYDPTGLQKVKIVDVNAQNGYYPVSYTPDPEYYAVIKNVKGAKLYSTVLVIPRDLENANTDQAIEFGISMPYGEDSHYLEVVDVKGNLVSNYNIFGLHVVKGEPSYSMIRGDELLANQLQLEHSKFNMVPTDTYLDITLIGDNYTSATLPQYHADVNRTAQGIAGIDPFKARAPQIRFNRLDNLQDLGCYINGQNSLICNDAKIRSVVAESRVPTDKIVVLLAGTEGAGNAYLDGIIAKLSADQDSGIIGAHELSHTLGLMDEYLLGNNWPYYQNRNCYRGTLPNPAWQGIVAPGDIRQGCTNTNWYRSYPNSIMTETLPYFNVVSQFTLNASINVIAGNFTPTAPVPTITITCPTNNYIDRGAVLLCLNYTNKELIARQEFWIDGQFITTKYVDFQQYMALNIPNPTDGLHTIEIRVFDGMNRGSVSRVTVDLRNNVPFGFLEGINNGQIKGWAIDGNNLSASIAIEFYQDGPKGQGVYMGSTIANVPRSDIEEPGNHGFLWDIPAQFRDGRQHTVFAYAYDTSGNVIDNRHLYNLNHSYRLVNRTWNFKVASTCGFETTKVAYTKFTNATNTTWTTGALVQGGHNVGISTQDLDSRVYIMLLNPNEEVMNPQNASNTNIQFVQKPIYNYPGIPNGTYKYVAEIDSNTLASGSYTIDFARYTDCTRTWTIRLQSTCGTTPVNASYAIWPPSPLIWNNDAVAAGVHTITITANNPTSAIYVRLKDSTGSLMPTGTLAHPSMQYGTFFNPPTPMAKWNSVDVPAGTYTITYQDRNTSCNTVKGGTGVSPDPISTSYFLDRKRYI